MNHNGRLWCTNAVRIMKSFREVRFYLISLHWLQPRSIFLGKQFNPFNFQCRDQKQKHISRVAEAFLNIAPSLLLSSNCMHRSRRSSAVMSKRRDFIIHYLGGCGDATTKQWHLLCFAFGELHYLGVFFFFDLVSSFRVLDEEEENRLMIGGRAAATETDEHFCRL